MPRNSTPAASNTAGTTAATQDTGGVILKLYGARNLLVGKEQRRCVVAGEKMVRFDVLNVPEGYKHYILEYCAEGSMFPAINASERHLGTKTLLRLGEQRLQAVCTGPPFSGDYIYRIVLSKAGSPELVSAETKVFAAQHPDKVLSTPEPSRADTTPELSLEEIYEVAERGWKKLTYPASLEIE